MDASFCKAVYMFFTRRITHDLEQYKEIWNAGCGDYLSGYISVHAHTTSDIAIKSNSMTSNLYVEHLLSNVTEATHCDSTVMKSYQI